MKTNPMSPAEVDAAFEAEEFLLFKHSHVCEVSAEAGLEYEAFRGESDVATGWIDVRAQRDLSRAVAERTGVRHESPQALLLRRGSVVWSASHWKVTRTALAAAVEAARTER